MSTPDGAERASRPPPGPPLASAWPSRAGRAGTRPQGTRISPEALQPCSRRVAWPLAPAPLDLTRAAQPGRGRPLPRTWDSRAHPHGSAPSLQRTVCGPREVSRSPRAITSAGQSPSCRRERLHTCGVQARVLCTGRAQSRQDTTPDADVARTKKRGIKGKKSAHRDRLPRDNRGPPKG